MRQLLRDAVSFPNETASLSNCLIPPVSVSYQHNEFPIAYSFDDMRFPARGFLSATRWGSAAFARKTLRLMMRAMAGIASPTERMTR